MSSLHTILQEGIRFHQQGLFPQAEQRYRRILSVQPDHGWAHHFLGAIAQEHAHHEAAILHFQQAAHSLPTNAAAWNGMGRSMFALKRYDDAQRAQEHAVALDSHQPNFYNNLGNTYFALLQFKQARESFLTSVELNPQFIEGWCNLGRVDIAQSDFHSAKKIFEEALSIHAEHWESWTNLGVALEGLDDMEQAGVAYQKAVDLAPQDEQVHFNLAQWYHKKERWSDAQRGYRQVIEMNRHHEKAYIQLFDTHTDVDQKIQILRDGMRSNPTSRSISLSLIHFYQLLESPRKAEELCLSALEHHQDDPEIFLEYIRALMGQLRLEEAEKYLATIQKKNRMVYSCYVALYRARADIDGAIVVAKEGLEHHSDSVELHNALGVLYAEKGQFDHAKQSYANALKIDPKNSAIQRHLSLIQGVNHEECMQLRNIFEREHAEKKIHAGFALSSALDKAGEYEEASIVLEAVNTLHRETFSYSVLLTGTRMDKVRICNEGWTQNPLDIHTKGPTPIFIVGLPRSGSTLTEQILSTHSLVEGVGEVRYLFDAVEAFGSYPECVSTLSDTDLHTIRETYLSRLLERTSAPFVVDKFLNNVWLIGLIRIIFPQSPILLMQRNLLDNGLSMYQRLFTQGQRYCYDLEELGVYINHHQELVAYWLQTHNLCTVEYEQLVHHPREQIQRLVEECGLSFEDSLLRFYETDRSVRTASLFQVRQPISTRSVDKWKKYESMLTPLKQSLSENRKIPIMKDAAAEIINMGVAFAHSQRHEQAQELYEQAQKIDIEHPGLWGNWLFSVIAQQKYDVAKRQLTKLPHSAEFFFYRAIIAEKEEDVEFAQQCYLDALAMDREYIDARFNLALLYAREEKYDLARLCYQEMLEQNPKHIDAQLGLGGIFIAQKEYEQALNHYEKVFSRSEVTLQGSPQLMSHALDWGVLYRLLEEYPKAESIFDDLIALDPDHTSAWYQKGLLYEEIGALDTSQSCFRKALELEPNNHTLHTSMGTLYKQMGEYKQAEVHFEMALSLEPYKTSAHNNLGNLYNTIGEFTKAENCYRRAIKEVPSFYDAYRHLVQVKKFRSVDDVDIDMMSKAIQEAQGNRQAVMQLSFALGKAYDDLGLGNDAFDHLLVGNAYKRETIDFSMDTERKKSDVLMSYFSSTPQQIGHPSDQPIFIVGMPRSGTSLCEQILASHSQVFGGGELHAMGSVRQQIQRSTKKGFPFGLDELDEREFSALGALYLEKLNTVGTGRYITDKLPNNFLMIGLIRNILPNAKIMYCRRDPRDNALSLFLRYFVGFQGFAYSLEEIGEYLVMHHRLMAHWLDVFGDSIFVLDYEKMVEDQEKMTRKIIAHCGLSYEPSMAEFYKTKRGVSTASAMQVRSPIYRSSVQKWKRYEQELQPLISILERAGLC